MTNRDSTYLPHRSECTQLLSIQCLPEPIQPLQQEHLTSQHPRNVSANLHDAVTLQRLLDCLLYALAIDDQVELACMLGMPDNLSNHEALAILVRQETQGIGFLDASSLFNYVFKQLEHLTDQVRRSV